MVAKATSIPSTPVPPAHRSPPPVSPATLSSPTTPNPIDTLTHLFLGLTMQSTDNPAPPAAFSSATFRFPQPEHYKGERDGFKCEWSNDILAVINKPIMVAQR